MIIEMMQSGLGQGLTKINGWFRSRAALLTLVALYWASVPAQAAPNGLQDVGTTAFGKVETNITSAEYIISGSLSLDQDKVSSLGKGAYLTSSLQTEQTITVTPNNTTVESFELDAIVFEEYVDSISAVHKVWIIGNVAGGGTVGSIADAVTGTSGSDNYSAARTSAFAAVRLTSFVIHIDPQTAHGVGNISLRSFTTTNAQGPNAIPMDLALSNYSVNQTNGANATVGILTTTDADGADTHTYLLVSGTGDTHNALFNLSGSTLRASNAGALAAGNYSIRIQTDDGKGGTYEKAFSIMVVDSTAPTVSIGSPSVASTSSGPVSYTVTYSGESSIGLNTGHVTVNTTGNATAGTVEVSGSGSTRTVTLSGITGAGTLGISLAAGTASDTAGNNAAAAGPSTTFTVVLPDTNAPTIVSITGVADGTYGVGAVLNFTVNFSEPVTLTGTDSTLGMTLGLPYTTNVQAAAFASKTATNITYTYTVQQGDSAPIGIYVGVIALGGSTLTDTAGNAAVLTRAGSLDFYRSTITGLSLPVGLAIQKGTNNLVVADVNNNRMKIFSAAGTLLTTFGSSGVTLNKPYGFAQDASGNFIVANTFGQSLVKYAADGTYLSTILSTNLNRPFSVAIDTNGYLYVADYNNHRIQMLETNGTLIRYIGVGQISRPTGVQIDGDGYLIVTDALNHALKVFQNDGILVGTLVSSGLNTPYGLSFDAAGNILVADYGSASVKVYTRSGLFQRSIVVTDAFPNAVGGVTVDPSGNVIFSSSADNQIQVWGRLFPVTAFVDTEPPTVSIGSPSVASTSSGPVSYTVTYSGESSISLNAGQITVNTTDSATANTVGVSGSGSTRTVTLSDLTGSGTLGISIASGTATDTAGNAAPAAGPSSTFTVVPNAVPTDLALSISTVNQSGGANATVGTFTTTDADGSDTHTYSLVSGEGDTDNAFFAIETNTLRANNASALSEGSYSIRIQTDDGNGGIYEKAFTITIIDDIAPTVSDANISISGASGTGGAYKIGDTVTATWNNTAAGDNNSDTIASVTVNFSQFGGGAAVAASNSSGTWTATYTITSGFVDASNRNISVTATDNADNATTVADTTNVIVDNIAPTVSDANISISGASGTGGAYKIGDTVTATWNNTAAGDNNSDTIVSVTVNFSQFGGGAAVAAVNSSGTWTATYTITSGAVDASNRNISVTATDNAGNATTRADTTNATVDNIAPSVSDANISISGASGTGGAYKIGDTVTATWNNTATGDNNSDTIASVTVNFSQFGGGAAVAAVNSSGTWTATYTITSGAVDASNRNISVTATDNAGNATIRADTTNATVDNVAPYVSDGNISISGASGTGGAYKIGDTVTATWDNSAIGDDNGDTIASVTVNFSQFGGGAAVAAVNSSGTWTATYTITSGAIDASNRNISVTATDNAGNATTRSDTTNATVDNGSPVITSAGSADGTNGVAFSYNIVATGGATVFGADGLPTGLSVNSETGEISGQPTQAGTFNIDITVSDAAGNTATQTLTLTLAKAQAEVSLANLSPIFDGTAKSATATTTPADLTVLLTYEGLTDAPTNAGSYEVIGTISDANYIGATTNTLVIAHAQATVTLAELSHIFDGESKVATATTEPADLTVVLTYNGSLEAPTNAGSYEVIGAVNEANYIGATTNTLVISPAAATVSLAGLNQVFDGAAKAVTASTEPTDLTVALTYDGLNEVPTNAGSYTVVGTITEANYAGAATNTLVITQASADVTLVGLSLVFDGLAKSATVTTTPADLAVVLTYDGLTEAPTNAGSYEVIGTISETNYAGAMTNTLVITQAGATVSLAGLNQIFDGTSKAATATTEPADLTVTLTYDGSAEAPTNAGSYEVIGMITEVNYAGAATNTLVISEASAEVTLAGLSHVYDGTGKAASFATVPNGLNVVLTYEGSTESPTNVGNYEVIGTITEANYIGTTTNTLLITQASAEVTLGGLSAIYDGTAKSATVTTTPADLTVVLAYEGLTDAPTNAGSYEVIGTVVDTNYAGTTTNTLVIAQAEATVTLAGLSQVFDGESKAATATTEPADLTVVLTYDGSLEAPTNAGSYEVVGAVNEANYVGTTTNTLVISPVAATISLAGLNQVFDGVAKAVTASTEPTDLTVTLTYDGLNEAPTNAGSYIVIGTINEANYVGATTNSLVIAEAEASVTLAGLNQVFDGAAKAVTPSTMPADLTVVLTYDGSTAAPTNAGSYEVVATITEANYAGATTNILVIAQAEATVTLAGLSQIFDGGAKAATAITVPADLIVVLTYNGSTDAPTNAGSYEVIGTIADANYAGVATNTLVISLAAPVITLSAATRYYTLGDGATPLDALANFSAPGSRPFAGGSLSVTIVSYLGPVDLLWFQDQESGTNRIAVNETEVSFDGTTIATYSGGVTGLASLQFSFTAQATEASIQEILRNVAFTLNREDSEFSRVIEFNLTDGSGATAEPVSLTLVFNHRPSLKSDRAVTGTNLPVQINYTRVLANDSDPDGDAFEIVAAAAESLSGGTVVTNETGFFYSPAADFKGTDQFSYTVLDARGGVATQSISVIVLSGGELAMEDVDQEPAANDQSATVVFMGIPGRTYRIQGSENLIDWTVIGTLTPSESGLTRYYDGDATNHMHRFYRTVYP